MNQNNKIQKDTWVNRMKLILPDYLGVIVCALLCVVACGIGAWCFLNEGVSVCGFCLNIAHWGIYGDFVGGVLGTLVAVFSVYYLVRTLREQQEANIKVSDNNREMSNIYQVQQFDTNYQHLILLYRESVSNYELKDAKGRATFKSIIQSLYDCNYDSETNFQNRLDAACVLFDNEFYIPHRICAAVHFRILYQIFNLIDTCDLDEADYKAKYAKLVRSQIDEEELLLLRYNCWCQYGQKMQMLVNHYNLLKHLPPLSLLEFKYWRDEIINDKVLQNALDTELIAQRKWLIDYFSNTIVGENSFRRSISLRYELVLEKTLDKMVMRYKLIKHYNMPSLATIDRAFDQIGDHHIPNFLCDYLHELIEFSNFKKYNELADLKYVMNDIESDRDRNLTTFSIEITAKQPIVLRYRDFKSGIHEMSPQKNEIELNVVQRFLSLFKSKNIVNNASK